ncbi:acid phosphatase [Candidatus Entotheonella serta]|nr:acid phosphatase [Candidatus Entotheonella serta]
MIQSQFIITTGDNFYEHGVDYIDDPHWHQSFEEVYAHPSLHTTWYPTLGNHDYHGNIQAQIDYSRHNSRWHLPARYYALEKTINDATKVQLIFLDTTPFRECYRLGDGERIHNVDGQEPQEQLAWLRATLAMSDAPWKCVIGHHPIYSGSPFHGGAPELQELVLPILREYEVQVYFCGHEHDLQYLCSPDVHFVVSGAGAAYRETGLDTYTDFCASTLGFTAVSLHADRMQIDFYNANGQRLYRTNILRTLSSVVPMI